MPKTPPGREELARRAGALIRQGRAGRTQAEAARDFEVSDSTWSRFESGDHVPSTGLASALDARYGLGGALVDLVRRILLEVMPDTPARTFQTVVFEPEYLGPVWVHLRAAPASRPVRTTVALRWGDWEYSRAVDVDDTGLALSFAKVDHGTRTTPLTVKPVVPLRISHGAGMPDHLDPTRVVDANHGWTCAFPSDSHEPGSRPTPPSLPT